MRSGCRVLGVVLALALAAVLSENETTKQLRTQELRYLFDLPPGDVQLELWSRLDEMNAADWIPKLAALDYVHPVAGSETYQINLGTQRWVSWTGDAFYLAYTLRGSRTEMDPSPPYRAWWD